MKPGGGFLNIILKHDRCFMAISNGIEAECHKHWFLQMFVASHKQLHIQVNQGLLPCSAIIVNTNIMHMINSNGEPNFTLLVDPTSELGRRFKGLLLDQPYYLFPDERYTVMQQGLSHALQNDSHAHYLSFARAMIDFLSSDPIKSFDLRVEKVLRIIDEGGVADEVLNMAYLSQKTGLSQSRLAHLFNDETGIPLKSYTIMRRLQKAYDALFSGENITTAALNAGFNSPSHFAYTNKLMTGMTASQILKDSEFLKVF